MNYPSIAFFQMFSNSPFTESPYTGIYIHSVVK